MTLSRRQFLASATVVSLPAIPRAEAAPQGLVVGQAEGGVAEGGEEKGIGTGGASVGCNR